MQNQDLSTHVIDYYLKNKKLPDTVFSLDSNIIQEIIDSIPDSFIGLICLLKNMLKVDGL